MLVFANLGHKIEITEMHEDERDAVLKKHDAVLAPQGADACIARCRSHDHACRYCGALCAQHDSRTCPFKWQLSVDQLTQLVYEKGMSLNQMDGLRELGIKTAAYNIFVLSPQPRNSPPPAIVHKSPNLVTVHETPISGLVEPV